MCFKITNAYFNDQGSFKQFNKKKLYSAEKKLSRNEDFLTK